MASQGVPHRTRSRTAAVSAVAQRAVRRVRLNSPTQCNANSSQSTESAQTPTAGAVQGCGEPNLQAPLQKRASNTITDNDPDATQTAKRHRPDAPVSESPCADDVMRCLDRAERGGAASPTAAQLQESSIAAADATVDLTADTSDDDVTVIEATAARPAWFVPPGVLTLESASPSVLLLLDEEGGNDRCSLEGDEPVSEETLCLPAAAVAREPSYEENPYNSLNGTVFLKVFLERYNWD